MRRGSLRVCLKALACLLALLAAPARGQYADVIARVEALIRHEMAAKELPALSIALIDDQRIVWARGLGFADPGRKVPATENTIYRVGSVSKLFTDIAIMQLAERGEVDVDAPVQRYLPQFRPVNPFGKPITLRQLMAHRSGLTREPPAGHYFDETNPTLAATVESLNGTELLYAPEARTKYSNAGIAVVGYVLERLKKEPFEKYVQRSVLDPIGMRSSSFARGPAIAPNLSKAFLWTYHGRVFEAPVFELGIGPAGNLYSTVTDLGRFLSVLFAGGRGPSGQILKPETLAEMWRPQFARDARFGIGFALSRFGGRRRIGHGGAVYGFATDLSALPDEKLGAVVVTTKDSANAVVRRIGTEALRLMLAARAGKPLPAIAMTEPAPADLARRLEGRYGAGAKAVDLWAQDGRLYMLRAAGGQRLELRRLGDALVVDGLLEVDHGKSFKPLPGALLAGGERLARVPDRKPDPAPSRWRGLIGEYGWDHNILYILEKDGRLNALIEWYDYYPLAEISAAEFRFPNWGLYDGERLTFRLDASGRAVEARVGEVVFKRRRVGPEEGEVFRIAPVRPVDELRREALAARPPEEQGPRRKPELVELTALDPGIRLDIRYAGTNNFLGVPLYSSARAFLQRPAAEALLRAHRRLAAQGYGLLIHDAYRPWYVTKMFWDATPEDRRMFVADPRRGSRHNRGCAVDLTIYDRRTGRAVEMPGVYDEMSERSYPDYPGGASLQRWCRGLLRRAMEAEGFAVYEFEWWHFDYKDWSQYPILNIPFEEIGRTGPPL